MTGLTIGSLFSGYGGLDMAVEQVTGARPAWFVEYDEAPSKILAHHWPDVPNYGDVTKVEWSAMPPVDIITGGSPCQDLSAAGKRAGMTEGTRSNLWVNMREAINIIRPKLVVWENVLGALSATATSDSDMEPGTGPLGDGGGGHLRALGRVAGDLAEIGYDAQWTTLRASDIGAPHHRARVFLTAMPADPDGERWGEGAEQPRTGEEEVAAAIGADAPPPDSGGPAVGEHPGESPAEEAGPEGSHGPGDHRGERPAQIGREGTTDAKDDGLACAGTARHRGARPADKS